MSHITRSHTRLFGSRKIELFEYSCYSENCTSSSVFTEEELHEHITEHHLDLPCNNCGARFASVSERTLHSLYWHKKNHYKKTKFQTRLRCYDKECSDTFRGVENLELHLKSAKHSDQGLVRPLFSCKANAHTAKYPKAPNSSASGSSEESGGDLPIAETSTEANSPTEAVLVLDTLAQANVGDLIDFSDAENDLSSPPNGPNSATTTSDISWEPLEPLTPSSSASKRVDIPTSPPFQDQEIDESFVEDRSYCIEPSEVPLYTPASTPSLNSGERFNHYFKEEVKDNTEKMRQENMRLNACLRHQIGRNKHLQEDYRNLQDSYNNLQTDYDFLEGDILQLTEVSCRHACPTRSCY